MPHRLERVPDNSEWLVDRADYMQPGAAIDYAYAAKGDRSGVDGDGLTFVRIRGPFTIEGGVSEHDETGGHARVLVRRGRDEYFVAGCFFSNIDGYADRYYLAGPMTLDQIVKGFAPRKEYSPHVDVPLLNAAGFAFVEEI